MKRSITLILSIIFIGVCLLFVISYMEHDIIKDINEDIEENIVYLKEIDEYTKNNNVELQQKLDNLNKQEANKIEEYQIWQNMEEKLAQATSS